MGTYLSPLATSSTSVIHTDLNVACLQYKVCPIIMFILALAVGNMSIAYKISIYFIFTQAPRFTDMQSAISRKCKRRLLSFTQQNKKIKHILHVFSF
jgi:hypothetical protein